MPFGDDYVERYPKVTFVIGAGASRAFGFPTGRELLLKIADDARNIKVDHPIARAAQAEGMTEADVRTGMRQIAKRLEYAPSIDFFLEQFEELELLGRLLIALEIGIRECGGCVSPLRMERKHAAPDDWLQWLMHSLLANQRAELHGRFSFVTFNYERTLEHGCVTYAESNPGQKKGFMEAVRSFPIVHMYGSLGAYPGISLSNGNPKHELGFGALRELANVGYSEKAVELLRQAASGIRLVSSRTRDEAEETHRQAQRIIRHSDVVVILGFGFDPENCRRLGLAREPDPETQFFFTCYDGPEKFVDDHIRPAVGRKAATAKTCVELLKQHIGLLPFQMGEYRDIRWGLPY